MKNKWEEKHKEFKKQEKLPKKILISNNIKIKPQEVISILKRLKEHQDHINNGRTERVGFSVSPEFLEIMEQLSKEGLIASQKVWEPAWRKIDYGEEINSFLKQQKLKNPDIIQTIGLKLNVKITEKGEKYIKKFETRLKRWHINFIFIMTVITTICAVVDIIYQVMDFYLYNLCILVGF